jgi:CRP-like cAMP-binding protein
MNDYSLDQLSLFQDFSPEQCALLRKLFQPCHELAGTLLFEQGAPAEHLYLVVDGEVHIRYKPDDGPVLMVARVRVDGVVGWSAALGSPLYTSSAVCATDCYMLCVRGEDLRKLYARHPETGRQVLERLAAVIAERLRNTHHHVVELLEQGLRVEVNHSISTR